MSDPRTVWRDALDALEAEVDELDRALLLQAKADTVPQVGPAWQAPAVPLPAELAPRAAALLTRHQELTARIEKVVAALRRQQRTASHLHARMDLSTAPRPVYVDEAV